MKVSLRNSGVVSAAALLLIVATGVVSGCKKDEPPPPLPIAKTAEPVKVEELKIPDAGAKKVEEEDTGKGKTGVGRPKGALAGCCAALRQNAANAPDPTKGHMLTAAAACEAANNAGAAKAGFLATLAGLLRGAGVPPACQ